MEGVAQLYKNEVEERGVAKIKKYTISREDAQMFNLRCIFNNHPTEMVSPGEYVRLSINGELFMTDTQMEKKTNEKFVNSANGEVMVAGLGIGLVLHNLRDSVKSGRVTKIVVYEKYQDVIDLVLPLYQDLPIVCKCEDILEYKPAKREVYDTIYFDIWPSITSDNLPEMRLLSNRWKNHLNRKNPECWMGSWRQKDCQRLAR